jgi:hypothetical protein
MAAAVSGRSVVFSPAPTFRTAASRFDRYSLIRRAVISPSGVSTLMGYTAQTAGMVLSVGALLLLVVMPIVGRLITVLQTRHLVAFGWVLLAGTMYVSTQQLDLAVSFESVNLAARPPVLPDPLHLRPHNDRGVHHRHRQRSRRPARRDPGRQAP